MMLWLSWTAAALCASLGAAIGPTESTPVQLQSLEVVFQARGAAVRTSSRYILKNPTDEAVSLMAAVPHHAEPGLDCSGPRTTVDGAPATQYRGELPDTWTWVPDTRGTYQTAGVEAPPHIHAFPVEIPAGGQVEVFQHYAGHAPQDMGKYFREASFHLASAAAWADRVDDIRFEFSFLGGATELNYPLGYSLETWEHRHGDVQTSAWDGPKWFGTVYKEEQLERRQAPPLEADVTSRAVLTRTDWEPEGAFWFTYRPLIDPGTGITMVGFYGPPSNCSAMMQSDPTRAELRLCRNHHYAVWGRPFNSPDLHRYFYEEHGGAQQQEALMQGNRTRFHQVWYAENPAYTDDLLRPWQHEELKRLAEVEARLERSGAE